MVGQKDTLTKGDDVGRGMITEGYQKGSHKSGDLEGE